MDMREVKIKPVLNGFIVEVGCQKLVYNSIEVLAADLVKYQKDPVAVEKEFQEKAVNKEHGTDVANQVLSSYYNGGMVGTAVSNFSVGAQVP